MDTDTAPSVNRIHGTGSKPKHKLETLKTDIHDKKCFRCVRQGYFAKDLSCPARDQTCRKCGKIGHCVKWCMAKSKSGRRTRESSDAGFWIRKRHERVCI
jgi:hypothetical protein